MDPAGELLRLCQVLLKLVVALVVGLSVAFYTIFKSSLRRAQNLDLWVALNFEFSTSSKTIMAHGWFTLVVEAAS